MKEILITMTTFFFFENIISIKAIQEDSMRMYVLFNDRTSNWAESRDVCKSGNGSLLSIENKNKMDDIMHLDKTFWDDEILTKDLWFGLHTDFGQSCALVKYKWQGGGPLGSWTNWYIETYIEPNQCETHTCIRISKTKWKTIGCNNKYIFICQYYGGACKFDSFVNTKITLAVNMTQPLAEVDYTSLAVVGNLTKCTHLCKTSVMLNRKCWAVQVNESKSEECILHYTNNRYLFDDKDNTQSEQGIHVYIRRCVQAVMFSGDTSNPFKPDDEKNVTQNSSTNVTQDSPTYITQNSSTNVTQDSPTNITQNSSTNVTQDSPTNITQNISTNVTQGSPTNITQNSSTNVTQNSSAINNSTVEIVCYKNVIQTIALTELEKEVRKLQEQLQVKKEDTVLKKMKKISVYEARPSAVGIGLIASVLLLTFLSTILISDIPVLVRHFRHFWSTDSSISPSA